MTKLGSDFEPATERVDLDLVRGVTGAPLHALDRSSPYTDPGNAPIPGLTLWSYDETGV